MLVLAGALGSLRISPFSTMAKTVATCCLKVVSIASTGIMLDSFLSMETAGSGASRMDTSATDMLDSTFLTLATAGSGPSRVDTTDMLDSFLLATAGFPFSSSESSCHPGGDGSPGNGGTSSSGAVPCWGSRSSRRGLGALERERHRPEIRGGGLAEDSAGPSGLVGT